MKRILENAGYLVWTANNGTEALKIAGNVKPDVVVIDLMMPGMSGREVCQKVRVTSPSSRVIYFTAKVESDIQKLKELQREADTLIAKPASSKTILTSVSSVLNKTLGVNYV